MSKPGMDRERGSGLAPSMLALVLRYAPPMSATQEIEAPPQDESTRLWAHRCERFMAAGATRTEAARLATAGADWHLYADLRARGATPEQAYALTRPL